jgi:pilus assembly protein Flp/PilA
MRRLCQFVANFVSQEDGPTAVEYAILLALIVVGCVSTVTTLGASTTSNFANLNTKLAAASS